MGKGTKPGPCPWQGLELDLRALPTQIWWFYDNSRSARAVWARCCSPHLSLTSSQTFTEKNNFHSGLECFDFCLLVTAELAFMERDFCSSRIRLRCLHDFGFQTCAACQHGSQLYEHWFAQLRNPLGDPPERPPRTQKKKEKKKIKLMPFHQRTNEQLVHCLTELFAYQPCPFSIPKS